MANTILCVAIIAGAASGMPDAPPATKAFAASSVTAFDEAIDAVAAGTPKWATVCVVRDAPDGRPEFTWHDYRDTGRRTDFWPASTIKLYAAVAALEWLNDRGWPLDAVVTFEHRTADGRWVVDCARTVPEMLSAVFRRSSNEDYTLLLRMVGIDHINTAFLVPARGFEGSALMRGYVLDRPWVYTREEPQRITVQTVRDARRETVEHTWSGRSYAEERGCTVIDSRTGNVTTPRDLAECMRRIIFHDALPEQDRFRLSADQLKFLRHGGDGLVGLQVNTRESGASAWKDGLDTVFPEAAFFHKSGLISSYALEVAYLDDSAHSGKRFILVPAINAGSEARPVPGEKLIGEMSRKIGEWVKAQP
jgi:hypothetical protein